MVLKGKLLKGKAGKPPALPSRDAFRKHLAAEIARPGVLNDLARVDDARAQREIEASAPRVIDWVPTAKDAQREYGLKPLEGSVTLFWGRKGGTEIAALEKAFQAHDADALESLHATLMEGVSKRSLTSVGKGVDEALRAESFFDLSYGGRPLANTVFLPKGLPAGSITLPYSGGKLDPGAFSIREYSKGAAGSRYDVLVLVSHPRLTTVEQRAIDRVPASMQDIHIGLPTNRVITVLVTIVVFVAINTIVTTCCGTTRDSISALHLDPKDLEGLSAATSARRLLKLRQQIFEKSAIR